MPISRRWIRTAAIAALLSVTGVAAVVAVLWGSRADLADLGWPVAAPADGKAGAVTVTWLGISTLLFDDGETQILTDGTFTRFGILDIASVRPVSSDIATINHALTNFRMNRLAAIIPLHSHFEHAMDAGLVANRGSAVILGSESTANIALGAGVPVDQFQILANGESRQFGDFTVTLVHSRHAPIVFGRRPWFPGRIEKPLTQPARIGAWRNGVVYSVFISHPRGTTLVQGSAGFVDRNFEDRSADVVMLGVAGLKGLGRNYLSSYWFATVTPLGAKRVFPIHYDDFTRPFGEVALLPKLFDNVVVTERWIDELLRQQQEPPSIELLPFGQPVMLY